jgi:serine/threonine protein kinase
VLLVKKKDTGKRYALKILKKEEIIRRNQYEHTMAERRILESVNDPFIVKMDFAF